MDKRVNKIIDLIENAVDEVSLETLQSYREKRLKEPLDQRTPMKARDSHPMKSQLTVEEVEESTVEIDEASIRDVEHALAQHAQRKIDHEHKYGPMSAADQVSHEKTRKLLLTKKVAAQRDYNKRVNNESMVARTQSGRKMVSAEAALRHAREIAHKRQPGSKPTLSDIAAAHRRLSSSVKHESEEIDELSIDMLSRYKKAASAESSAADRAGDTKKADKRFSGIVKATKKQFAKFEKKPVAEEVETIDESFAVKNSSGETVDVKFSESEATKRAEELTQKMT